METAKHRVFVFLPTLTIPDNKLIVIGSDDAYLLGCLSSRVHVCWAHGTGATLEDRPVYVKTTGFDPFPFPACSENQVQRIRALGEALDAHRKRQQALHPKLTITGMYNVLEKLRSGEPLTEKERKVHEIAACGVLRDLHDELDRLVAEAYGWPWPMETEEILARLVTLHDERVEEERRGLVRWLRPDYQVPRFGDKVEGDLTLDVLPHEDDDDTPDDLSLPAVAKLLGQWGEQSA